MWQFSSPETLNSLKKSKNSQVLLQCPWAQFPFVVVYWQFAARGLAIPVLRQPRCWDWRVRICADAAGMGWGQGRHTGLPLLSLLCFRGEEPFPRWLEAAAWGDSSASTAPVTSLSQGWAWLRLEHAACSARSPETTCVRAAASPAPLLTPALFSHQTSLAKHIQK